MLFPSNAGTVPCFTSLHINTNVEIFLDGLFAREAQYYGHLHPQHIPVIFFWHSPLENVIKKLVIQIT